MNISERIEAFVELGRFLHQFSSVQPKFVSHSLNAEFYEDFKSLLNKVSQENPWFTKENLMFSVKGICCFLTESRLKKWVGAYRISTTNTSLKVAVVMAGNIPMVGFHDMLCVLMSGHAVLCKLSSKDALLLPFIGRLLVALNSGFSNQMQFQFNEINATHGFDAIIATGSNNSARYFEANFSECPNLIRRNRNSVAVLLGNESKEELKALGDDIFLYFGLGCRNVSKLYLPKNYDVRNFAEQWQAYETQRNCNKYFNNYNYQRSLLKMNKVPHIDKGFFIFRESGAIASPISILHYEYYTHLDNVKKQLQLASDYLQCVVGKAFEFSIPFGETQKPCLFDYPDNIDIMKFLTNL